MRPRFRNLSLAAMLAIGYLAVAGPALAQSNRPVEPPADSPKAAGMHRSKNLDFLFEALKVAPDDKTAKAISDRIWEIWLGSGGDTTNLLMSRVKTAVEAKELDLALQLLDSIIEFKPDYVEGWDRRATVYFMKKQYGHALADLAQVLGREPRHFGALFGLGVILQEFGEEKRALQIFRRLLEMDPHMERVPELVKTLTDQVEGRDI